MKLKKIARRLAGALVVGSMMVSMLGMTVLAEDTATGTRKEAISKISLQKTINKRENTYLPDTTFTFKVENGAATDEDGNAITRDRIAVKAGVGGVTIENIVVTPLTADANNADKDTVAAESVDLMTEIKFDSTVFDAPGIYHYVVTEEDGNYDGMTYDTKSKDLYVYVQNNATNSGYEVYAAELVEKDSAGSEVKINSIVNTYGKTDTDGGVYNLTVQKKVTGDQGDKNKKFHFVITIFPAGDADEMYAVGINNQLTAPIQKGGDGKYSTTVELANDDTVTVYGLSENDTYSIVETEADQDGYTTNFGVDNVTNQKLISDKTVTCTNDRSSVTPTGLILNIAPYILMVALAGVLAFFFLRRRKSEF